MAICHLLYVQVFHYLLFTLLHSVLPHLLFGYIRFAVILHLLAGITSRVCKEPPSGACYQSCMFSLHLPSLPLWLVDKFFGCTCFHGLIVSTDLQQYLCLLGLTAYGKFKSNLCIYREIDVSQDERLWERFLITYIIFLKLFYYSI